MLPNMHRPRGWRRVGKALCANVLRSLGARNLFMHRAYWVVRQRDGERHDTQLSSEAAMDPPRPRLTPRP